MLKNATAEFVCSLEVSVMVSYMTASGVPRVQHSNCLLPLRLVARPSPPAKEAEIKLTFNTNVPVVNLLELFPGILFF